MSANGIRRRLQRDVSKLNKSLRAQDVKRNNRFVLPYFEQTFQLIPKQERRTDLTEIGLADGDLVYITKGEHKGKISTLFRYTPEFDTLYLSDISEKKVVPKNQWFDQQASHLIDYPTQIPRDHVKLAAKEKDEAGNVRYIVADEIKYQGKYFDENHKRWLPRRFIKHHSNIEIPWPAPSTEPKDGPLSTNEQDVLEKTFEFQSLAISPIPTGAMDQLRNRYSKHKSKILSELDVRRLSAPEMPLSKEQKIYLAKKEAEGKKPVKDLTEEMKEFIGERIANHLSKIDNPNMKIHLESLSKSTTPHFEKLSKEIEDSK